MNNIHFISGIDTDAGKTAATGWLARKWIRGGVRTVTQKLVQTGNTGVSEDILCHRKIMGCELLPEDHAGLTAPEIYTYPASPHLAAALDKRPLDIAKIDSATRALSERFDAVLLEGAGGLMVPLTEDLLTIDFVCERNYPVIFVTSAKLGSINHTLLALEALKTRGMKLETLLFNSFPDPGEPIRSSTEAYIRRAVARDWPDARFEIVPLLDIG